MRRLQNESRPWPRYELIAGHLLVTSAPTLQHQRIVARIFRQLAQYLEREPIGEVLLSPADLTLLDETVSQPDVFVVPREVAASAHRWPDIARIMLAVEVASPSTMRSDRGVKREHYQAAGVNEYWIVDAKAQRVERWRPADTHPELIVDRLVWLPDGAMSEFSIEIAELLG